MIIDTIMEKGKDQPVIVFYKEKLIKAKIMKSIKTLDCTKFDLSADD